LSKQSGKRPIRPERVHFPTSLFTQTIVNFGLEDGGLMNICAHCFPLNFPQMIVGRKGGFFHSHHQLSSGGLFSAVAYDLFAHPPSVNCGFSLATFDLQTGDSPTPFY
jgi:hypothetical protein